MTANGVQKSPLIVIRVFCRLFLIIMRKNEERLSFDTLGIRHVSTCVSMHQALIAWKFRSRRAWTTKKDRPKRSLGETGWNDYIYNFGGEEKSRLFPS
jgi:hypothetical protein